MDDFNPENDILLFLNEYYGVEVTRETLDFRGTRFFFCSNYPIFHQSMANLEGIEDLVTLRSTESGIVSWSLNLEPLGGSIRSLTSTKNKFKIEMAYKHRHEFVSEAISIMGTDRKFREVFRALGDDDDVATPDFIMQFGGANHIIEITTCLSENENIAQSRLHEKLFTYETAALARTEEGMIVTLTIIVVTPSSVFSNVELNPDLVTELIARQRIAIQLERLMLAKGIEARLDMREEIQSQTEESIKKNLSLAKMPRGGEKNHVLQIDEKYYDRVMIPTKDTMTSKILLREIKDTMDGFLKTPDIDHASIVKKFLDSESEDTRSDAKVVVNFPFFTSNKNEVPSSDIKFVTCGRDGTYLTEIWSGALEMYQIEGNNCHHEDISGLMSLAYETDEKVILTKESINKSGRNKYHRVDLHNILSTEELLMMAEQGVWAKQYATDQRLFNRRKHQKKPFSWSVDTKDIDKFIHDESLLMDMPRENSSPVWPLIELAEKMQNNKKDALEIVKKWSNTRLFNALEIMSAISIEIAISNKQHCKKNQMVLKKLRDFNVYLLISPTSSLEHVFFSVFQHGERSLISGHEYVFQKGSDAVTGTIYDFTSMKAGKIENKASMPSALLALASFWSWFYDLEDASPDSFRNHREAREMLMHSLLIRMEDKAETEETITQTRYAYMEIFKSNLGFSRPNPFKILSKLPTQRRSRLSIYYQHKIILNFSQMINNPPIRKDISAKLDDDLEKSPRDFWTGLKNWFTGGPVEQATKAINLVYLGYLKNKDVASEGNTDFQLIEKICEEEMRTDYKDMIGAFGGAGLEKRPKEKQFNLDSVKMGCDILSGRLEKEYGSEWKTVIGRQVMENLGKNMTNEIASLKAACSVPLQRDYPCASLEKGEKYPRMKVLEAVKMHLDELGLNPFTNLHLIVEKIEKTTKAIVVDIFKKSQHGGLREIYVMNIQSRVVQLFLETISRTLCSHFEEETLTHPRNKLKKIDEHRSHVTKICQLEGRLSLTYCSSSDKTRWNQYFLMSIMIVALLRLTPPEFHPMIIRCINLWCGRLIKLPDSVISMMLKNTPLSSDVYEYIKKEFWDKKKNRFFDKQFSQFMRIGTGMMQGILHYTSSLLHLTYLSGMGLMVPAVLKSACPDCEFHMTQVCSSDDSAVMISAILPRKDTEELNDFDRRVGSAVSAMMEVICNMAPYYCMKESVKSTIGMMDYLEYNSEFNFGNTVAVPKIKLVAACTGLTESESFMDRFYTVYNLKSDLFSSGLPAENTHLCELAQAFNHYVSMGLYTSPLFGEYAKRILDFPDPQLGFFLTDCDLCPGLLGYSYSHWIACQHYSILRYKSQDLVTDEITVTEGGGIVSALSIKFGDLKRWKRLIDNVCAGVDVMIESMENPRLFFAPPRSLEELRISLAMKSTMPSVGKSLRKGNPYIQALAMSCYSLTTHCFTKKSVIRDLTGLKRDISKTSILRELKGKIETQPLRHQNLPESIMQMSFPFLSKYKESKLIIDYWRNGILIRSKKTREVKTEIMINSMNLKMPLSLQEVCCELWFGMSCRGASRVRHRCLEMFKLKLPWIRPTFSDSLKESPFSTPQEMAGFIKSQGFAQRRFVRVGPSFRGSRFPKQLTDLIRKSQRAGHLLVLNEKGDSKMKRLDIFSRLALCLSLPTQREREDEASTALKTDRTGGSLGECINLPKRECILRFIQGVITDDPNIDIVFRNLIDSGRGVLYAYPEPQRKMVDDDGNVSWVGRGKIACYFSEVCVILVVRDNICEEIITSSWHRLSGHASVVQMILKELRMRPGSINLQNRDRGSIASFDGLNFRRPGKSNLPIKEDRCLKALRYNAKNLKVKVSENYISVNQPIGCGREVSVAHLKTYPNDIIEYPSSRDEESYRRAWVTGRSLTQRHSVLYVLKAADDKDSKNPTKSKLSEWIERTLMHSLIRQGLAKSCNLSKKIGECPVESVSSNLVSINIEKQDEMMMKIAMTKLDKAITMRAHFDECVTSGPTEFSNLNYDDPELYKLDTEWVEVAKGLLDDIRTDYEPVGVLRSWRGYYTHPIWDNFIKACLDLNSSFWKDVLSGVINQSDVAMSKSIMKLFSIKERALALSLTSDVLGKTHELDLPTDDDYQDDSNSKVLKLRESTSHKIGGKDLKLVTSWSRQTGKPKKSWASDESNSDEEGSMAVTLGETSSATRVESARETDSSATLTAKNMEKLTKEFFERREAIIEEDIVAFEYVNRISFWKLLREDRRLIMGYHHLGDFSNILDFEEDRINANQSSENFGLINSCRTLDGLLPGPATLPEEVQREIIISGLSDLYARLLINQSMTLEETIIAKKKECKQLLIFLHNRNKENHRFISYKELILGTESKIRNWNRVRRAMKTPEKPPLIPIENQPVEVPAFINVPVEEEMREGNLIEDRLIDNEVMNKDDEAEGENEEREAENDMNEELRADLEDEDEEWVEENFNVEDFF